MLCLEFTHGLGMGKAFGQSVDEDRIQTVNAGAVFFQKLLSFENGVCLLYTSDAADE